MFIRLIWYLLNSFAGINCGHFNTIDSRKTARAKKFIRKGSMTPMGTIHSSHGICHSETMQVMLDCSQGSGLVIGPKIGAGYTITQIISGSVAEHSGCIQIGDRLLSINKLYNLDANTIRQILGDNGSNSNTHYQIPNPYWVELEIEVSAYKFTLC